MRQNHETWATVAGTDSQGRRASGQSAASAQGIPPDETAASTPPFLRDSYAATAFAEVLDRSLHAAMARFTAGVSPMTLIGAYADWAAHLSLFAGQATAACRKGDAEVVAAGDLREPQRAHAETAASPASSRCRRTGVSSARRGGSSRTI